MNFVPCTTEVKDLKPGDTISVPGFISKSSYGAYTHSSAKLESMGHTTVMPFDLVFTIPEGFNGIHTELSSIDSAMALAADAYHQTVGDLKLRKAKLLQLSHNPSDGVEVLDAIDPLQDNSKAVNPPPEFDVDLAMRTKGGFDVF